jgi:hypothetical protein
MSLSVLSAMIVGGFLPTFIVEVMIIGFPPIIAGITAGIDAAQAGIWAVIALLLVLGVVDPILIRYRKSPQSAE